MFELTGVEILGREHESHVGWDPRFGVWKPVLRRINTAHAPDRPHLVDEVRTYVDVPVPPVQMLWRGADRPGDSMGNITYESLAILDALGLGERVRFSPFPNWVVPATIDLSMDPRASRVRTLLGSAKGEEDFEIQVPGYAAASGRHCMRYLFHEFGTFPVVSTRPGDVMWGASEYIAEKLRLVFPKNPAIVAPHGVNTAVFFPEERNVVDRRSATSPCRFLYVGTSISRKGIDLVWNAFLAVRRELPGAELVIKVFPTTSNFIWPQLYEAQAGVQIVDRPCSIFEMAALMRSCDVLVAPSRAEAFCIPVLEAMASGLPVIVTRGGAMDDFCPRETCYPVTAEMVLVKGVSEISFLEPDLDSLMESMRAAYATPAERRRRGEEAAAIARLYSWKTVTQMALAKGWAARS